MNVYMQLNLGGKGLGAMTLFLSIPMPLYRVWMVLMLLTCYSSSHSHSGVEYPCTLVHWFSCTSESPNENTSMWEVKPDLGNDSMKHVSIIHLDTVVPQYDCIFIHTNSQAEGMQALDVA